MRFEYTTNHFPTGTVTKTTAEFESEADMLRHLNKWNIEGKGVYLYTVSGLTLPHGYVAHNFKTGRTISQERTPESVHEAGGYWIPVVTP